MPGRSKHIAFYALACAVVLVLDQLSKAYMRSHLPEAGSVTLIPGVMDLRLVFNEGAAFSVGEGFAGLFVFVAVAVAVASAAYVLRGHPSLALSATLGAVAGGGIGNLIDRVAFGSVTDFFMPTFVDFAVFNVADIFLTCGAVLAFVLFWREDAQRERQRAANLQPTDPDASKEATRP